MTGSAGQNRTWDVLAAVQDIAEARQVSMPQVAWPGCSPDQ